MSRPCQVLRQLAADQTRADHRHARRPRRQPALHAAPHRQIVDAPAQFARQAGRHHGPRSLGKDQLPVTERARRRAQLMQRRRQPDRVGMGDQPYAEACCGGRAGLEYEPLRCAFLAQRNRQFRLPVTVRRAGAHQRDRYVRIQRPNCFYCGPTRRAAADHDHPRRARKRTLRRRACRCAGHNRLVKHEIRFCHPA